MRKLLISFGITILISILAIRLIDPDPVSSLRYSYFDQLQKWQPRAFQEMPIRIIDIDEEALAQHGQWPWPRHKLADLVDRLSQSGAAVIVFDILFVEEDRLSPKNLLSQEEFRDLLEDIDTESLPNNDDIFARAIQDGRVVLGVAGQSGDQEDSTAPKSGFVEIGDAPSSGFSRSDSFIMPLKKLVSAALGFGSINMNPNQSAEIVRFVPLLWQDRDGQVIPSLALEALRVALGESNFIARGDPDLAGVTRNIQLGNLQIPTLADANLWVRYRLDHPSVYISAHDVLTSPIEEIREGISGSIVLVGTSAAGLLDIRTTALGENVPGVSIHAQIIEQILQGDFLVRSDFTKAVEIIIFILLGGFFLWVMSKYGAAVSIVVATSLAGINLYASWILFIDYGVLLDATLAIVGGAIFFASMTALQFFFAEREKKLIRQSFSHYVAPEVLQEIEKSGHKLKLGGETRPISVMFCDIRNFTALSETMEPTVLVSFLNNLFSALSTEIMQHKGTIDKFIGDSVMAFWNAPLDVENYPYQSCCAALAMRTALDRFNSSLNLTQDKKIGVAIGISMGPACVGNVGSKQRFDYSAIGDTVNRASRIESCCREVGFDILVSERVAQSSEGLAFLFAGCVNMKGVSEKQNIYALIGDETLFKTPEFEQLLIAHSDIVGFMMQGERPPASLLQQCRDLAHQSNVDLDEFYRKLSERGSDFQTLPSHS